ncbi:MAG: Rnase Y domain-containing protein, partial [Anaerolineales bacterium]|nr:Rnase Y domain-containing protein [Anaerolineales bacterium]
MAVNSIILGLVAVGLGALVGFLVYRYQSSAARVQLQAEREKMDAAMHQKERDLDMQSREELHRRRDELEKELAHRRRDLQRDESRLDNRRVEMEKRVDKAEKRENALTARQSAMDSQARELEQQAQEYTKELERVAGLTTSTARDELMAIVEKESRDDMVRVIRGIEDEAKIEGESRARKLLVVAMQRVASEQVSEYSMSILPIPTDDIKGRIIGRNGRNIRAFEQAARVDVVVDDTPEAVMVSSFDPVRREVARRALKKLVLDGRIHPAQIEKTVNEAKKEVEIIIKEEGE